MRGGRWNNSSAGSLPRSLLSQAAEEYQRLLASLPKPNLCVIVQWKMEGFTNQEIAVKLALSVSSVERKLRIIRGFWEADGTS